MHFYFYMSSYVQKIDYKIYDLTSIIYNIFKEQENATYSVIVDIDEESIQTFGQWPWSRVINAELIAKINQLSPSGIGLNILSSEKDRTSPLSLHEFYQKHFNIEINLSQFPSELHDNDKLLSEVITNANVTLPIFMKDRFSSAKHCQKMRYKGNMFKEIKTSLSAGEVLCNHQFIQEGIKNFGFINAWSDSDGIFRRVPLFIKYKEEVFPSLALATLLSFYEAIEFPTEEETVLVNFSTPKPKIISALDILNGEVDKRDIQGKVLVLGSSIVGLRSMFHISSGEALTSSMIQAILIDNIVNDAFLLQPHRYKQINIVLSILLSFIVILLLSRKAYLAAVLFILILLVITMIALLGAYKSNLYISLGYLWVPFLSTIILFTLYHLRVVSQEQQEQEYLLIRQSKLASMGEMISLIAHQWRQPLSAINGTVLNMDIDHRKEKLDAEKFEAYLASIESTTAYLSKTINDFTDFFSKTKQAHIFNLKKVIHQAQNLSAFSKTENVSLIYRECEEIEVNGYPSELIQSLLVLFNNAIYICEEKIETIGEGKVYIDIKRSGNKAIVLVEDNGGGVAKKDMKKIFDPYFTTKEKHNGTGLGLYILRLIVEDSMNGKVSLHNGKEGAVFSIEIPLNMG